MTIAGAQTTFTTETVVPRRATASFGTSLDLVGSARTPVGRTVAEKFLDSSEMHGAALGLMHRGAVPIETKPFERSKNDVDEFGPRPLGIGVFDAKHKLAALLAGEEPVEKGGSSAADMEIARR